MKKHGAWMKWEQAMDRKVTWQDIWKWNPQRIKFLIQGVYDILPSGGKNTAGNKTWLGKAGQDIRLTLSIR